jgi:hypothetical protein
MFGKKEKEIVPASICGHNVTVQLVRNSMGKRGAEIPFYCDHCLNEIAQEAVTERGVGMIASMGRRLASLLRMKPKHT